MFNFFAKLFWSQKYTFGSEIALKEYKKALLKIHDPPNVCVVSFYGDLSISTLTHYHLKELRPKP